MNTAAFDITKLNAMAKRIRLKALEMAYASGDRGAHISGSLSCVEIYTVLYGAVLYLNKADWENRDRFIAGKEHARLAEFPAMAEAGMFPFEYLDDYEGDGRPLAGHRINCELGIEYCSCSLGMALPFAVGKALYAKERCKPYRVISIIGDGECTEGSIWEAATTAANYGLDNLILIVDQNHMSVDGNITHMLGATSLSDRFEAFGWKTVKANGHDIASLLTAFSIEHQAAPLVIIAETIKGKGVSFMENNKDWHQTVINQVQFDSAYTEVKAEGI